MTQILAKIIADFDTQLSVKMSVGATTGSLTSIIDDDGVTIPNGRYFLTIDKGSSKKEYISCTLTGTALSNIKSLSRQGVETTGCVREHRVGANVIISDFGHIKKINDLLDGTSQFDSATPLGYDGTTNIQTANQLTTKKYVDDQDAFDVHLTGDQTITSGVKTFVVSPIVPTPTAPTQVANKAYADGLAIAGAPNASTSVKGIVQEATLIEVDSRTNIGTTGAKLFISPSQIDQVLYSSMVAGEDITTGSALMVASGNEARIISAQYTSSVAASFSTTTSIYHYQSFITGINTTKIQRISGYFINSPGFGSVSVTLRTTPNGANLFTPINTGQISSGEFNIIIPNGQNVSSNTTYYIIFIVASSFGQGCGIAGGTVSGYASGVTGRSNDNGVTWSTPDATVTGDFYFKVFETDTVAGRVYLTTTNLITNPDLSWSTFIGFAINTVTKASSLYIKTSDVVRNFSGLTIASTYYLSDTAGAIASTAGTVVKKIGLALSATSLLIKHDN